MLSLDDLANAPPAPCKVHLYNLITTGSRDFVVPEEHASFRANDMLAGEIIYTRSDHHTLEGLRVYHTRDEPYPINVTLGWAAPEGWAVASRFDRRVCAWWVLLSGHNHSIELPLCPLEVAGLAHFRVLDEARDRVLRADHQRRRSPALIH